MLLGGLLVALGVVAGAVADRIRAGRHRVPAVAPARARVARGTRADTKVGVGVGVGPATAAWVVPGEPSNDERRDRLYENPNLIERQKLIGSDVVTALTTAGYKRGLAKEATRGCSKAERASLEDWTRAALQRATALQRGVAS
jgi:hypothetical protein